ncbi:MAG TPA: HAMP domain-containing sensor histidine kinase, partial [Spirochaetota bacterium]|nr:HAMP domain-containing sensor histidine kinase [Spirochaetota bacterium]
NFVNEHNDKKSILKKHKYVRISIKDQGIGIPEDMLNKIFDPYFTTNKTGGGLGLATSYSIIKKHEGTISVESKVNIGTTFHIYLPAID